jgi:hypothetical protein
MAVKSEHPASEDQRKERVCLKCQASFGSEWAGERICPRCKGTEAWRSGFQVQVHSGTRSSKRSP